MSKIKQIKPKVKNISDKYSANLYEFCKRHAGRFGAELPHVYYNCTQSKWDKKLDETIKVHVPFDKNKLQLREILLGFKTENGDWYHGGFLASIIGDGKERFTIFANPWWRGHEVIDITEWFWTEYIKVGRCIWDREHTAWLRDDDNRFVYINKNSRKCQWCGEWQHREIKKRVVINRKETWTSGGRI